MLCQFLQYSTVNQLYICMYVYVYIYVCVCVCVYMYTQTHTLSYFPHIGHYVVLKSSLCYIQFLSYWFIHQKLSKPVPDARHSARCHMTLGITLGPCQRRMPCHKKSSQGFHKDVTWQKGRSQPDTALNTPPSEQFWLKVLQGDSKARKLQYYPLN